MSSKSSFGPVRRRSIEDEVYMRMREAILKGEIEGGERLVHEDLASRFGTSRIPVRDALKRLVFDGLVDADERGVCRVSHFGLEDVEEIYSLREMLEAQAVVKATAQLTDEEIDELERLQGDIEAAAEAGDKQTYVELNQEFHRELYDSADQPRLSRMIYGLWQGLPPLTPMAIDNRLVQAAREHRGILSALRERDADAAGSAMREHIATAGRALYDYVASKEGKIR
ncbi:GntR family transcriptional regulator [Salinisphaera orenii MK-B5]|uniref:GntR family transcriptional regulator n=2 Tax=Salinisphaera orenii TaxID=856731 RepID=A0A423PFY4_9GAMM|nr:MULTISPECIES: GntR family transcriptional regulator [Salinisphaera]ROO24502.1 GntR family transcriptional regulator [Salinisphaera orenii MK-B5]ROO26889.1 GntR family transcriptional regulator [Salinisphaera halophila YIM 95161]